MTERIHKEGGSEFPQSEAEWPSERIIDALGKGVTGLRNAFTRIKQYFSMPGPSDELLDQGADKLPNDKSGIDHSSVEILARMASYGSDRFHTPYL